MIASLFILQFYISFLSFYGVRSQFTFLHFSIEYNSWMPFLDLETKKSSHSVSELPVMNDISGDRLTSVKIEHMPIFIHSQAEPPVLGVLFVGQAYNFEHNHGVYDDIM